MKSPLKNDILFDELGRPMMNTSYSLPDQAANTPAPAVTPRIQTPAMDQMTRVNPIAAGKVRYGDVDQMYTSTISASNPFTLSNEAEQALSNYSPTTKGPGFFSRLGASQFGQNFMSNISSPEAMAGIAGGIGGILQGAIGRGRRRDAQRAAQTQYDDMLQQYQNLDTSNLYADVENQYANLENTYEDLTVNQQQAQFERRMFQQQQADTLQGLSAAAGGSGIAGLAQAMANQGQIAAQRAGASIGMQESKINMLRAQEASRLQMAERGGEVQAQMARLAGAEKARSLDYMQTGTQLAMAQQDLAAKNQAIAQADKALYGGIGQLAGTAISAGIGGI